MPTTRGGSHGRGLAAAAAAAAACCATFSLSSPSARGNPLPGEPLRDVDVVQVRYRAPPPCPGDDALAAAVRDRAPMARLRLMPRSMPASVAPVPNAPGPHPASARVLDFTITASEGGYLGTLVLHRGDQVSSRQLSAHRCDDLVAALALVGALAIERDPSAASAPSMAAPRPAPPASDTRWTARMAGGGGLAFGTGPGAMWLAGLEGQLGLAGLGHLGLAASFGRDRDELEDGAVQFTWASARASACWTPFERRGFEGDACGHFEVGGLRARGMEIVNAAESDRLWLAAGVFAGLRHDMTSGIFGELQLGASLPVVRDRFYFQPNVLIHQASPVTTWLTVGAGYRFR